MGGNALSVATRRYEKKEFFELVPEVTRKLEEIFPQVHVTTTYKNKDSFGDMDILVESGSVNFVVRDELQKLFNPAEIYRNSHIYSFDYKELQIDVILTPPKDWETAITYFSYNDLGNFMGRIANRFGLKYGHFGLAFNHTHDGMGMGDIMISRDIPKIYEFLGFDYDKFLDGFNELEDVFEYVVNSKYFTPQLFAYENLDHQNRTRNAKRNSYQAFLDYIKENEDSLNTDESFVNRKKGTNMTEYEFKHLKRADSFFGVNTIEQIAAFQKRVKARKEAHTKFNGNSIMEKYGFEGKELGEKMKQFKSQFPNDEMYTNFIASSSLEQIFRRFESANKMNQKNVKRITLE